MKNNRGGQSPFIATLWSLIEKFSSEIIGFIIGIVLARLLSPHDYGVVGLTVIFIAYSSVFIESGFTNALIRKTDRSDNDLSTAFFFNVFIGIVCYIFLFVFSPYIAIFFDEPVLETLIRVISINVFLNSLCIVQIAILSADLNIRLLTIINLCGQIPGGVIAIYLAYYGFGVYSLVIQQVSSLLIRTILLWIFAKWRPQKFVFDGESFKYLWNFGSKMLLSGLIGATFDQIHSVLIGKYIGKNELGYYSKGRGLSDHVTSINTGIVQKVVIPILARCQTNIDVLKANFREMMKLLTMFVSPIAAFCVYAARDIILFLWTDKWLQTVPMFQLIVCCIVLGPIGALSLSLLQVVNRTDIILKIEILKKTIFAIVILISFQFGIYALLIGQIFNNILAALVNMYPTKNILRYNYFEQLIDIFKYVLYSYFVGAISFLIPDTGSYFINIILIFVSIGILYPLFLWFLKDELFLQYAYKFKNTVLLCQKRMN